MFSAIGLQQRGLKRKWNNKNGSVTKDISSHN